ncbi:recombinase family protein [Brevundimonas sp.]|uniref:recombinase family protein n=1 Tax=Brevundimonas sp. TaxID=1871086 RepID=UPI0035616563
MKPPTAVSYLRVSTSKQSSSGLGREAQREAVSRYLAGCGCLQIAEFVETETGKGVNALARRPQLREALALAKREGATLVIAKIDRLARNVHFVSGLMETGVPFVATDMPHADRFQLHLFAALAEKEAEQISRRTKEALAAAKARGIRLGRNAEVLCVKHKSDARDRLRPYVERLRGLVRSGHSVRGIAEALNAAGLPSPGGGRWHIATVQRALARL